MARVLIPLAGGFEEIEAVTLIDVLRRAGIEVVAAGLEPGAVRGSHGIALQPDTDLDSALLQDYDLVALPGGMPGAQRLRDDARIRRLVTEMAAQGKRVAAICAAPMVLASAGLLRGRAATSYPGFLDASQASLREDAVVRDGPVTTSRGPGTALEFALTLVEQLAGAAKRAELAAQMLAAR